MKFETYFKNELKFTVGNDKLNFTLRFAPVIAQISMHKLTSDIKFITIQDPILWNEQYKTK